MTMFRPLTRRTLLYGSSGVALTAALPAAAVAGPGHLRLGYRPSQPTGWQPTDMGANPSERPVGVSLGGHTVSKPFTFDKRNYRISLLPLDAGSNPVYQPVPAHPTVALRRTLDAAFGRHYAFRYLGGLAGRETFTIESYSVFADPPAADRPGLSYGMNLFFTYQGPRRGEPAPQFIQVVNWVGSGPSEVSEVDNAGRANPFFVWGGATSVYGRQLVCFNDAPQAQLTTGPGTRALSEHFVAEVFLVRDTGVIDRTGRCVITVHGGITYGWQVTKT